MFDSNDRLQEVLHALRSPYQIRRRPGGQMRKSFLGDGKLTYLTQFP